MSRKANTIIEKQREVRKLTRVLRSLDLELRIIVDRHNYYRVEGGEKKVIEWFDCLPIESLGESLGFEHGKKRQKFALQDLNTKQKLRKKHEKKLEELEDVERKRMVARIELMQERINRVK